MTSDLPTDVDVELTRFMRRTRARTMRDILAIDPKLDFGSYLFLVTICDAGDGIRASDLADAFGVHKSTVSRAISSLETLELITRTPDPRDGRAQLLAPTPKAVAGVETFREKAHTRLNAMLVDWAPDELQDFASKLGRLNDAAESYWTTHPDD